MSSKVHSLKTHSVPYQGVISGRKTFEIRKNDRDFQVGDILKLREWNGDYTGRHMSFWITYILPGPNYGVPEGYCIMSIIPVL